MNEALENAIKCALADIISTLTQTTLDHYETGRLKCTFFHLYLESTKAGANLNDYSTEFETYKEQLNPYSENYIEYTD